MVQKEKGKLERKNNSNTEIKEEKTFCMYCKAELVDKEHIENGYHDKCFNEMNRVDVDNYVEEMISKSSKEIIYELEEMLHIELYSVANNCLTLLNPFLLSKLYQYDEDFDLEYFYEQYESLNKILIYFNGQSEKGLQIYKIEIFGFDDQLCSDEVIQFLNTSKHLDFEESEIISKDDYNTIETLYEKVIFREIYKNENKLTFEFYEPKIYYDLLSSIKKSLMIRNVTQITSLTFNNIIYNDLRNTELKKLSLMSIGNDEIFNIDFLPDYFNFRKIFLNE